MASENVAAVSEPWAEIGRTIEARIDELRMTDAEVIRLSTVSDKTLARYKKGKPIVRVDKRRGLCEALRWTSDSIERLLRGEPAVALEPPPPTHDDDLSLADVMAAIEVLHDRVESLAEGIQGFPRPPAGTSVDAAGEQGRAQ